MGRGSGKEHANKFWLIYPTCLALCRALERGTVKDRVRLRNSVRFSLHIVFVNCASWKFNLYIKFLKCAQHKNSPIVMASCGFLLSKAVVPNVFLLSNAKNTLKSPTSKWFFFKYRFIKKPCNDKTLYFKMCFIHCNICSIWQIIAHSLCEIHYQWSPETVLGAPEDVLTQTCSIPHACMHINVHAQMRKPLSWCKEAQSMESWLELQLADAIRL